MAKAKQGPSDAQALLALIPTKHQHGPRSHTTLVLERLRGTPLGEAFEAAMRDVDNYSTEAIARFMRTQGHNVSAQSIGKWRRDNGLNA